MIEFLHSPSAPFFGGFLVIIGIFNVLAGTVFSNAIGRFEAWHIEHMKGVWPEAFINMAISGTMTRRQWHIAAGIFFSVIGFAIVALS